MIESFLEAFKDSKRDKSLNQGQKRNLQSSEGDLSCSGSSSKRFRSSSSDDPPEILSEKDNTIENNYVKDGIFQRIKSWIYNLLPTEEVIIVEHRESPLRKNRKMATDVKNSNYSGKENQNGNYSAAADISLMKDQRDSHRSPLNRCGVPGKYGSAIKISHGEKDISNLDEDGSFQFQPTVSSTVARPVIRKKYLLKSAYTTTSEKKLSAISKKSLTMFKPMARSNINSKSRNQVDRSAVTGSYLLGPVTSSRSPLRRQFTAQESFKLDEKFRYKALLQNFTSSVVHTSADLFRKYFHRPAGDLMAFEKAHRTGAIVKECFDSVWGWEKKGQLEKSEQPLSRPTKLSHSRKQNKSFEVIDLEPDDRISPIEKEDNDIVITKEIIKPSPIKNSLEERLRTSPFYTEDHFRERKGQYEWRTERQTEAAESVLERSRQEITSRLEDKLARRLARLELTYTTKVIEIPEEAEEELPELTQPIMTVIIKAVKGGPGHQVVAAKFNIQVTRRDIHTLTGLNWLNDEVINFYMHLIMDRNKEKGLLNVYAFNTFFYPKLIKSGYSSVRRWTKKVDVFNHELLIIPIHLGMHWCLATIDLRDKTVRYYDSLHGDNFRCLQELLTYLNSEHMDKKKTDYDTSAWNIENIKDIPQQMNGSDCGMFSCKFAEYLSRDSSITFSQEHMPYFRKRMIYEICTLKLM